MATPDSTDLQEVEIYQGIKVRRSVRQPPIMRLTAQRMLANHLAAAPATSFAEGSATGLVQAHAQLAQRANAPKVTISHVLVRLLGQALLRHPELNATLVDDTLKIYDEINIGVAAAVADGNLVVPVIRGVDKLSVDEIAVKTSELVACARNGKLKPADMRGGTFTVSNIGMFPAVLGATPILNLPQTGILAVGAIQSRVVIQNGKVEEQPYLGLSLTFDHRAVNGYVACQFLQTMANFIADPAPIL